MGSVYRAEHAFLPREVALKVLREDQIGQDRAVDRMMREAATLASITHGGIPRFFECGMLDDGRPWIAMELVAGSPLQARLSRGAIIASEVIALVADVAEVLAAAHDRGFTHRDLKPDNIFLVPGDPVFPVRVIDWGIAYQASGARLTSMNEAIGTPTYMAPEQARGGPTDGHCDIYGLGVVAYHALTGHPPFVGETSIEILVQHLNRPLPALAPRCPDAPAALIRIVERMLRKSFADRPAAAEVSGELRALARALREDGAVPLAPLDMEATDPLRRRRDEPYELEDQREDELEASVRRAAITRRGLRPCAPPARPRGRRSRGCPPRRARPPRPPRRGARRCALARGAAPRDLGRGPPPRRRPDREPDRSRALLGSAA
jgi:serine/threonine protein kinase